MSLNALGFSRQTLAHYWYSLFKTSKVEENKTPFFERMSNKITHFTGSSHAFMVAVVIILVWAVTGPLFNYSSTWQLIINTGTTIITFLMVFIIQKSQNKESKAIQLKLNELVASAKGASNRLVNIEDLDEMELDQLHALYNKLTEMHQDWNQKRSSESIELAIEKIDDKVDDIDDKVEDMGEKVDKIEDKLQ